MLTQIILQSGIGITGEPKIKIQDPISKQTLMKSNAQLKRDDLDDAPQPPPPPHSCSSIWHGIFFSDCSSTFTAGCWLCLDFGGFSCTSERHEHNAADTFISAALRSLDQPPGGAEPAGHPGVSQASSSVCPAVMMRTMCQWLMHLNFFALLFLRHYDIRFGYYVTFFLELLDIITMFTLILCPFLAKRGTNFLFGPGLYF